MTASAQNLLNDAIGRAIAPRKPLTVSEWADAHRGLSAKDSPEAGRWRTARNPPLREPMDCLSARSHIQTVVLKFPIQFGKALALDTPIPTPSGWSTMAELAVGDRVFGADGTAVAVTYVSPRFDEHACYRLTFSDGAQVVADGGHEWKVIDTLTRAAARHELRRRAQFKGRVSRRRAFVDDANAAHQITRSTAQLATTYRTHNQSRYAIEVAAPLNLATCLLPLDPYLLGVWLGDGSSDSARLTLHEDDCEPISTRLRGNGHYCKMQPDAGQRSVSVTVDGRDSGAALTFHKRLARIGLLRNKHIPAAYLRASAAQRLALLQGLLDTDGHASPRGTVEICSSHPQLAPQIVELIRTLGYKPRLRWRRTHARDSARITFTAYCDGHVFSLARKNSALPAGGSRSSTIAGVRHIVAIDRVATTPTRCIAVDAPDHLFLCGRELIPTHNTQIALNFLGYTMAHSPGPIMVCLPGEDSRGKWVFQKLTPMLDKTPAAKNTLTSLATRNTANQRNFKDFAGGQLYIEHAGSPARLKSSSVRYLAVDEVDEFADRLQSGDDPLDLLDGRTSAFPATAKKLYISTPGIQGISRIDALYEASDQRRYYVPCPDCGHEQPLEWRGLHWDAPARACWYVCRECGVVIEEHHKTAMIAAGRWVAKNPESRIRGYTLNCLYYAIGLGPRWLTLVDMWRNAQNDPARLKTFINDRLAESFEDPAMRAVKHNVIRDRAEPYPLRFAPNGVLAITAGVDTQDNRLAVQLTGWGRGMALWVLDYIELLGDPAEDDVWVALTDLLNRPIEHESGAVLRSSAVAIDGGGHRTEAVKSYVRSRRVKRPMVVFGAKPNNAPVLNRGKLQDVNWRGKYEKRGMKIYQVGTVAIKHWLYSRLSADADKPAREERLVHMSEELPPEYFGGVVSETFDPRKNRFVKRRGPRNEPLDVTVYSVAAAHHPELRLHRYTRQNWDDLERNIHQQVARAPAVDITESRPPARPAPRAPASGNHEFGSEDWQL